MTNNYATGTFTGLIAFLIIGGLLGGGQRVYADDSLTVSISGNPSITVAPGSNGTFADSGDITISVSNAPSTGYTLAITGGGNTSLTGKTDDSKSITSIDSAIDRNTFNANADYNNKWGYKPSMHYNVSAEARANNDNYLPAPDDNADIIDITDDNTSNSYTLSIGARVTNTLGFQTYENNTFVIAAVGNGGGVECDSTKLCVQYDGNGLTFDGETMNKVNYDSTTAHTSTTKYAHMSNVGDDGVATGTLSNISSSGAINDTQTVTIDGAKTMMATIYYDTYSSYSYGYVSLYQTPYTISTSNDATVSATTGNLSGRLYGSKSGKSTNYATWNSKTYAITGDTAKFHFYRSNTSTSYRNYYGYYAVVTSDPVLDRTVLSGEYAVPIGTNVIFHGWSTTQTTAGGGLPSDVEYVDEDAVKTKMSGDNGDVKTLYAVWQQMREITFMMDNNVISITVLDGDGNAVGTITGSGQSLVLAQGDAYTIKLKYVDGYTTDTVVKTAGEGVLDGRKFTVGGSAATISVASKEANTFDKAFAAAGKTKYNGYYKMQDMTDSICSAVTTSTEPIQVGTLVDSRDNIIYSVGKLADGKCWMLDNLAFNGKSNQGNGSYITMDSTNTNIASGSTLKWSSTVGNWTSSSQDSYTIAYINDGSKNMVNSSDPSFPDDAKTWKYGVYYNFCAASAGTMCAGSYSEETSAEYDICPAGWRIPTGRYVDSEVRGLGYVLTGSMELNLLGDAYMTYRAALRLPLSGEFHGGSSFQQGEGGGFWESTDVSTNYAWGTGPIDYGVRRSMTMSFYDYRSYGYPVRCIAGS